MRVSYASYKEVHSHMRECISTVTMTSHKKTCEARKIVKKDSSTLGSTRIANVKEKSLESISQRKVKNREGNHLRSNPYILVYLHAYERKKKLINAK